MRFYTTRELQLLRLWDWDQSHARFSALRVTVLDGIRSPDLPLSRRDLYRHRCLGPRNPSARSIYLPFRLERRGLKYKQGTSRIRTQVVGMERPGLHWRLGFNVGIPGPVPVNRMNQNLRKQPGWTAKLSMSWNKMEILIHPTNFYNRGNTTAYHFWVGPDIPGRY